MSNEIERRLTGERYPNNKPIEELCLKADCRTPKAWAMAKGIKLLTLYYRLRESVSIDLPIDLVEPPPDRHFRSTEDTERIVRCACSQVGVNVDDRVFRHSWTVASGARAVNRHHTSLIKRMGKWQQGDPSFRFWLTMSFFLARRQGMSHREAERLVLECSGSRTATGRGDSVPCYPGKREKL